MVNDTIEQQILFIENMNFMKLVSAIFTLYHNAFWYFLQVSEENKSDNDNNFKISLATYCAEQF